MGSDETLFQRDSVNVDCHRLIAKTRQCWGLFLNEKEKLDIRDGSNSRSSVEFAKWKALRWQRQQLTEPVTESVTKHRTVLPFTAGSELIQLS